MTSMKPKKPILVLLSIAFLIFILIIFLSSFAPNSSFKKIELTNENNYIQLVDFPNLENTNLNSVFPHEEYIKSDNWKNLIKINEDLNYINSVNINKFQNMDIIIKDITVNNKFWNLSSLDSLNMLVKWAETFNIDDKIFSENSPAFRSIYNYWMGLVAKSLDNLIQNNYNLKFDFRVKYLRQRCIETTHGTGTSDDGVTKIITNIIDQKWHYLFVDRLWNATSNLFKFILIIILIITLVGYILFFTYSYNLLYKLINNKKTKTI